MSYGIAGWFTPPSLVQKAQTTATPHCHVMKLAMAHCGLILVSTELQPARTFGIPIWLNIGLICIVLDKQCLICYAFGSKVQQTLSNFPVGRDVIVVVVAIVVAALLKM